ncbi:lasso peptide biosynthesis B2 protein [Streptomyces sp. NPDC004783]|uniref:lasso peptide biosynthesis B2 protein n=1 Tax=Streptomyces sp. NPDC004783 TaxID=3154459 RepID=UPI0033B1D02A
MTLPVAPPAGPRPSVTQRLSGTLGFAAAVLLLRLPLRRTTALVRLLHRLPLREPTPARAARIVQAARSAGAWWPGRAACLETSLAATLAATAQGYRLSWCLGVRFLPPPRVHHAWVETTAGPAGEPETALPHGWPYAAALRI